MGTLADKLAYLDATKEAIKTALQNKGITVLATDTFRSYAQKIANIVTPSHTTLSVTPSTSSQSLTPSYPYNGYSQVNVSAVDNTIDANIQAGNIKSGVSILGVTGTMSAGNDAVPSSPNLNYIFDTINKAFSVVGKAWGFIDYTDTQANGFVSAESTTGSQYIISLDGIITSNSNLGSSTIGNNNPTSVQNAESYAVAKVTFNNLQELVDSGLKPPTVVNKTYSFPSLKTLTRPETSRYIILNEYYVGYTIHFPVNMQSTIEASYNFATGFNGTNTTIIFDLPDTSNL